MIVLHDELAGAFHVKHPVRESPIQTRFFGQDGDLKSYPLVVTWAEESGRKTRYMPNSMANVPETQPSVSISNEALAKMQRMATVGVSAAGAAHEINNLLTAPMTYCQLAQRNPEDEEIRKKAIQFAMAAMESIRLISGSMLDFVSSKRQPASTELHCAVETALGFLHKDPNKLRIQIENRVKGGTQVQIHEADLCQILLNLLLNAMNAISNSGLPGRIAIEAQSADDRIVLRVADNGPGISQDATKDIFKPFLDRSTQKSTSSSNIADFQDGNGLGLLVCKQLAEANDGEFFLVRSDAEGTVFELRLKRMRQGLAKAG